MFNLKLKITNSVCLFAIIFICVFLAYLHLLPSIANAETVVWTAKSDYKFTHGETKQQAKIISMAQIRQALLYAAGETIRATTAFKTATPMTNRAKILAAGVMKFDQKSMTLKKTAKGYIVSLVVAGRIVKDTLSSDLNLFMANRFHFDNAHANQILSQKILEQLESINQELDVKKLNTTILKNLRKKRTELVNGLSAIAIMENDIIAGLSPKPRDPASIIKKINKAMAMDDRNAWLYLHRGRVYLDLKDWVAAYHDFTMAANLDTHIIHAHELKGDALNSIGDKEAAIAAYTTAINLYLAKGAPLLKRGRLFLEDGKYRQAQKDFSQVIKLDPNNPAGYIARGEAYLEAKQSIEAVADFTTAIKLKPRQKTFYVKRGRAQFSSGLVDAGCADILKACELGQCRPLDEIITLGSCDSQDSSLFDKWSQITDQAVTAKEWQKAIQAATLAIYYNPKALEPYINRAWAYAETNLLEDAQQDIDKAIKIAPDNSEVLLNQGLIYEKNGEWGKAAKSFYKACEKGMELSCKNYLNASKARSEKRISREERLMKESLRLYSQKDWVSVERLTSQIIQGKSANPQAYTLRAAARAQQRQYEKALADCEAAIEVDSSYGLAYNNRGYILERKDSQEEALVDYHIGCLLNNDLACQNYERLRSKKP